MGTQCPSAASPGDPLGTFPSLGKYLAPQGETLQKRAAKSPAENYQDGAPSRRALRNKQKLKRRRGQAPALQGCGKTKQAAKSPREYSPSLTAPYKPSTIFLEIKTQVGW